MRALNAGRRAVGEQVLDPFALAGFLLLGLNDHWLKAAYGNWWTGKLSDVAGMVAFPFFLVAMADVLSACAQWLCGGRFDARRPGKVLCWSAVFVTGLVFAAIKTSPLAGAFYERTVKTLWDVFAGLIGDETVPRAINNVVDPTDLVALPFLLIPLWIRSRPADAGSTSFDSMTSLSLRSLVVGCVAFAFALGVWVVPIHSALACPACTCDVPYGIRPYKWNRERPPDARLLLARSTQDQYGNVVEVSADDIHWADADTGEPVEFEVVETEGSGREVWLVPTAPLTVGHEYHLWSGGESEPEYPSEAFVVVESSDTAGFPEQEPQVASLYNSSACSGFYGAELSWESLGFEGEVIDYQPIAEVTVRQGANEAVLYLDASGAGNAKSLELASPFTEDAERCWSTAAIPFAVSGPRLEVTVTLYDLAGNGTTYGPMPVDLGQIRSGGCGKSGLFCSAAPPSGASGVPWVTGLFALVSAAVFRLRRRLVVPSRG